LFDLHHGKHLLDIEIEVVRLFGMLLHPPNQSRFVGVTKIEPARAANYFRQSAPP